MTDGHPEPAVRGRVLWTRDLAIDTGRQRVERAGSTVELPKLSYDLLIALVEASPNVVSLGELMTRVWKDVVVSPETVTQRVKLLRDALGDSPRESQYIEGLRGRGYRWIPEVEATAIPDAGRARIRAAPRTGLRIAPVAGVALAIALLPWAWRTWKPDSEPVGLAANAADSRVAAVLPFDSEGNGELGNGLADSVAASLGDVRGLTVISRYSSRLVDDHRASLPELGRRLGARYLVTGHVQQQGESLRVTSSVTDSESGRLVWTRQYTHDARDFFGLQDEVARGVMQALQSQLAGLDPALPRTERSSNSEAWLAYLRGRSLLGRTTVVGTQAAAAEFGQALELDPNFVPALAGLYDARMQEASLRHVDLDGARRANASLLARAERLRPGAGATQLAAAMWSAADPQERIAGFEAGLARDPGNARAMTAYSELLDGLGRPGDAAEWLERALRVDPLWPRAHFRKAQRNFRVVGSAVEQQTLRMLELDPQYYPALQRLAKYRWMNHGETAQAISIIRRAIAADPGNPWALHTAVVFYLDVEEPGAADAVVEGNAVAEKSTRAVRAMYRGDWRGAGIAAYDPASLVFAKPERWGVPVAVRDYGLRSGDPARAMQFLSRHYDLPREGAWHLGTDNFREAQLYAHLLLASGARDAAMRRLDEVIAWIDANGIYGPVYNLRTRAQAMMLKGQTDAALEELDRSFREKDRTLWWYTLRFDPTWDAIRQDPRFLQIAEHVQAEVRAQGVRLAQLRAQGVVP